MKAYEFKLVGKDWWLIIFKFGEPVEKLIFTTKAAKRFANNILEIIDANG